MISKIIKFGLFLVLVVAVTYAITRIATSDIQVSGVWLYATLALIVVFLVYRIVAIVRAAKSNPQQATNGQSANPPPRQESLWAKIKDQYWFQKVLAITILFSLFHFTVWIFFQKAALYREIVSLPSFWIGQVLIILVFLVNGNSSLSGLAKILIFIISAGFFWQLKEKKEASELNIENKAPKYSSELIFDKPMPKADPDLEKFVREFWTENLKASDAMKMIEWARRSSNFRQFEPGEDVLFRGRRNWHYVGIMGIDEYVWFWNDSRGKNSGTSDDVRKCEDEFGAGSCNIFRGLGNLNMALYIFRHYGGDAWWRKREEVTSGVTKKADSGWFDSEEEKETKRGRLATIAPIGKNEKGQYIWSDPVDISKATNVLFIPEGHVKVRKNGEPREWDVWPNQTPPDLGNGVRILEYRSVEDHPVEIRRIR